jgi:hypothetical protein
MIDEYSDEVHVLREHKGWTVVCGGERLERFDGKDEFRALARACEWGSKYAEARGIAAWFLQEGRRTPIRLANTAAIWKPKG